MKVARYGVHCLDLVDRAMNSRYAQEATIFFD